MTDCVNIIGDELFEQAWGSKLPSETQQYGEALLDRAQRFAAARGVDLDAAALAEDPESDEFHLDVVLSAGKWCLFWSRHGHWLESYS